MQNLIPTKKQSSEQHVELGTSQCNRDFEDLTVFLFDTTNSGLKSLANGMTQKDNNETNCDNAESIGHS